MAQMIRWQPQQGKINNKSLNIKHKCKNTSEETSPSSPLLISTLENLIISPRALTFAKNDKNPIIPHVCQLEENGFSFPPLVRRNLYLVQKTLMQVTTCPLDPSETNRVVALFERKESLQDNDVERDGEIPTSTDLSILVNIGQDSIGLVSVKVLQEEMEGLTSLRPSSHKAKSLRPSMKYSYIPRSKKDKEESSESKCLGFTMDKGLPAVMLHPYPTHLQMCPKEREPIFFTRRGVIEQWQSWMGPLVLPLGLLWLNGVVDFPLLGFLTLGLVSRAPRG